MRALQGFRFGVLAAVLSLSFGVSEVHAQQAEANVLFDEGRNLMAQRRFDEAVTKLKQSNQLDPAVGTLLNLGECYVALGRTTSAWTAYREAASLAASTKQRERERFATQKATELESQLSRLTIVVPPPVRAPGLTVLRDGILVPEGLWSEAFPVDPGMHEVEARLSDKRVWNKQVQVAANADKVTVEIPKLEAVANDSAGAAPAPAPSTPEQQPAPVSQPSPSPQTQTQAEPSILPTLGWVSVGVGAVGLATGVGLFLSGRATIDDANCPNEVCVRGLGDKAEHDSGRTREKLGVGIGVVGAALAATGVVLLVVAPKRESHSQAARGLNLQARLTGSPNSSKFELVGRW
jgi:hypothetical protein